MALEFKSQVIKNPEKKIKYKIFKPGGKEHYHLGVWLDGSEEELDKVEKVKYLLHQTFRQPLRTSQNRKNKFSITFWTWGMFVIKATICYKSGEEETQNFYLSYELPEDNGENYIRV